MKKFFVIISTAAVFAAVSCSKEAEQAPVNNFPDADEPVSGVETVISANVAESSKTSVGEDGEYFWNAGDAINVFTDDGTSCGKFTTDITDPSSSADFTGNVPEGKAPKFALYPYDATASCTSEGVISTVIPTEQDGTIASALSCAVSSDGKNFNFINAVSVISLKFNASDNICGVSVQLAEAVAGNVEFNCSDGTIGYAASKVVSVNKTTALSGTVYLTIAPTESRNISLTFTKLDDATATMNTTVKSAFKAGHIRSLGTVSGLAFTPAGNTMMDFAKKFVKVLDVWAVTPNTVNQKGGHMIPSNHTITLNGTSYNKSNMYEVALRGFTKLCNGGSLNDAVPEVHNYGWGTVNPDGENATYNNDAFTTPSVTLDFLRNYTGRQIKWVETIANGNKWANYCGYPSSNGTPAVSGYQNCCLERHLLMMARFYKYLLDNDITSNILTACADVTIDACLYESATLMDFAKEFSDVLEVWAATPNTVNQKGGHMIPTNHAITVGGMSYNKSNMYEVAVRGLDSFAKGGSLYDTVPGVHSYAWGTSIKDGANVTYKNDDFKNSDVSLNFIRNFADRQIIWIGNNSAWANTCGYNGSNTSSGTPTVSGYYNACGLERHLLMMARFYKYLLDENINYNIVERVGDHRFDSTLY